MTMLNLNFELSRTSFGFNLSCFMTDDAKPCRVENG